MVTKLVKPSIKEGFRVEATNEFIEFELLDGGNYTLNKGEFYDAFTTLFSDEFSYFILAINKRNELQETVARLESSVRNAIRSNTCDELTLLNLTDVITFSDSCGHYNGIARTMREQFIELLSWNGWINVCRLYETFTGIDRNELG